MMYLDDVLNRARFGISAGSGGAIQPLPRDGPKCRGNYPEGSDHPAIVWTNRVVSTNEAQS